MRFSSGELDRVETARLVLRRPANDDLDDLHRIHGDPATWEHSPESIHTELAQSEDFLRRWLAHWRAHGFGYWAVEHEGEVVGFGGLWLMTDWQGRGDVLNIYYRFAPGAWGKGLASEMVAAALALAPPLPVVARMRPTNEASTRVAVRAGFERRPELDAGGLVVYARGLD